MEFFDYLRIVPPPKLLIVMNIQYFKSVDDAYVQFFWMLSITLTSDYSEFSNIWLVHQPKPRLRTRTTAFRSQFPPSWILPKSSTLLSRRAHHCTITRTLPKELSWWTCNPILMFRHHQCINIGPTIQHFKSTICPDIPFYCTTFRLNLHQWEVSQETGVYCRERLLLVLGCYQTGFFSFSRVVGVFI